MAVAEPILLRGRPVVPGSGPFTFGILNCTPDSFSDGGLYATPADAIAAGCRMADEGADAIDVGGESTRPGSLPVPPDEQIRRTQEVIAALVSRFGHDGPAVSIDTLGRGRPSRSRRRCDHRQRRLCPARRPGHGRAGLAAKGGCHPHAHAGHAGRHAGQPRLHRRSGRSDRVCSS